MSSKTGFKSFWLECLAWAYWKWEGREPVVAYSVPIVNGILTIVGLGGIVGGFISANIWWITLLPIFVMLIVVAPYRVWKKSNDDLRRITEKRLHVSLVEPDLLQDRDNIRGDWFQEWHRIKVYNPTALPISGCYGKLVDFRPKIPYPNLPSPGIMFPWTSVAGRGKLTRIAGHDFDLLDVLVFDGDRFIVVILDDASGLRDLRRYRLLTDEYDLIIQVGSQDEAFSPSYMILRIEAYVQHFKEHLRVKMLNYNPDCLTKLE